MATQEPWDTGDNHEKFGYNDSTPQKGGGHMSARRMWRQEAYEDLDLYQRYEFNEIVKAYCIKIAGRRFGTPIPSPGAHVQKLTFRSGELQFRLSDPVIPELPEELALHCSPDSFIFIGQPVRNEVADELFLFSLDPSRNEHTRTFCPVSEWK